MDLQLWVVLEVDLHGIQSPKHVGMQRLKHKYYFVHDSRCFGVIDLQVDFEDGLLVTEPDSLEK